MEGIKLTNFTKSKEIYDFLERQFTNEFSVLKIPKNSSKLIDFIISVFKDYPSFRMYFTGYTNDEKEAITYLMSTLDLTKPNQIKAKIISILNTIELQYFCDGVFDDIYIGDESWNVPNYDENAVKLIGDWIVTLIKVTSTEQTTEFALTSETNDNEFSIYFLNGKFNHSYDENGNYSNINEETFPLLITECEKWSRDLLGIVEDNRIKLAKSKFGNKVSIPSDILSWVKDNGLLDETKEVARWYNKLTGGRNFVGGTSIGKSPQTLILDITSNSSDIYISGSTGRIDVCGVEDIETYKDFVNAINTKYIIG